MHWFAPNSQQISLIRKFSFFSVLWPFWPQSNPLTFPLFFSQSGKLDVSFSSPFTKVLWDLTMSLVRSQNLSPLFVSFSPFTKRKTKYFYGDFLPSFFFSPPLGTPPKISVLLYATKEILGQKNMRKRLLRQSWKQIILGAKAEARK